MPALCPPPFPAYFDFARTAVWLLIDFGCCCCCFNTHCLFSPTHLPPELIFNFSQLSVNEISGEVMDIEVANGSGDDLHRHEDSEGGGGDGGDGGPPPLLQQSTLSGASTSSSTSSSSSCSSLSSSPSSPSAPQLPDIVSSHRSASFRERSAVAAASKHLHRNTLPSFNAEHISSASVSGSGGSHLHHHYHHHHHHHQAAEPRRTMSVSLPIEEHVISSVASQLRQISSDFSSSRQVRALLAEQCCCF